jgi:uncharacterized protein (TIGR00255 family)
LHNRFDMNSMTGYGRGEASSKGVRITVEVSSVNRKQSEVSLALPRELESLEPGIRDIVAAAVSRGRVNLRLNVAYGSASGPGRISINTELARQYLRETEKLGRELNFDHSVTLDSLLRVPGILEIHSPLDDPAALWSTIEKALRSALKAFQAMRQKEGSALARDLRSRVASLRDCLGAIRRSAPLVAARYRDALLTRLKLADLPLALDDERLLKEIALFADRSDISEELARLASHFEQFDDSSDRSQVGFPGSGNEP